MRIIARSTLRSFWEKRPDAEQALKAWFHDVEAAQWERPADVKATYGNASIVGSNRIVFNIKGNDYCLIVMVRYDLGIVFIRFIGSHRQYDAIDARTI